MSKYFVLIYFFYVFKITNIMMVQTLRLHLTYFKYLYYMLQEILDRSIDVVINLYL